MAIKPRLGGKAMQVPRADASAALFWPIDQVRSLLRQRAEKKLIEAGFDREWYLDRYPDVRAAKVDPLSHFLKWGAREGRDPNPLFWTAFYLAGNPDARDTGSNPLAHYLRAGWREGRDPNPLFDSAWYLRENPDVGAAGANPLLHYIRHGAAQGSDPHPLFDTDWYLGKNPDVRAAGVNPLAHFLTVGARTGCDPHPLFDSMYYLERNPDVRDAGINPLVHYLQAGPAEQRNPNRWFDNDAYMARYPDVRPSGLNPLVHYRLFGAAQGRDASRRSSPLADRKSSDLQPGSLFDLFQSLGDNCELGLVQSAFFANQLGLFKFASTPIEGLIAALRSRFDALTSADHIDIRVRTHGPQDEWRELWVISKVYGIGFHAGRAAVVGPDKLENTEIRRLGLLTRMFIEDMEEAEKIFVYKSNLHISREKIEELHASMRAYGPVTLLWVTVETSDRAAGIVEEISEGLLRGYIDRFAPYEDVNDYSAEVWKTICANARDLWLAKRAQSGKP
jgi:hypothetical protein